MKRRLERLDTEKGRAYVLRKDDGTINFLPSVTTVLSQLTMAKVKDLEEEIGKEQFAAISDRAAKRGTCMHTFLENMVLCLKKGGSLDTCLLYTQRKSISDLSENFAKDSIDTGRSLFYNIYHEGLLQNVKKVLFSEAFLYSENHLYAGASDFGFLSNDNKIVIVDFKTASGLRDEETVHKYEVQVGAYAQAFSEMTGKRVDIGEIWISHPGGIQLVSIGGEDLENKKEEFKALCKKFHEGWESEFFEDKYNQLYGKSIE